MEISDSELLRHPTVDVLQLLSKYEAVNPVYLHRELGISFRQLYSCLKILEKAKLIGFRRFSRYNYFITEEGRKKLSQLT
jgi:predicted AAA+ superfamily ATPase